MPPGTIGKAGVVLSMEESPAVSSKGASDPIIGPESPSSIPLRTNPRSSRSKYTVRDFLDLNNKDKAYASPLAVIAHVDVNAFFAQVEQIRLGCTFDDPVVCVQWTSLIAVSYAARKFGISRMTNLEDAKKKCPGLVIGHTAVFKKGSREWSYTDYLPSPVDHKVSLDPYRRESRKMMKVIKSFCDLTEKASVDESFLDMGRLVYKRACELFPELLGSFDDLSSAETQEFLPKIPDELPVSLQWHGFIPHTEEEVLNKESSYAVQDWDDIFLLIASQLGTELRTLIYNELGYLTSLGIARVKTLAKLASGFKKPNNQTIVRNSAINEFLTEFDFTDFWTLGGKAGAIIRQRLNIPETGDHDASHDNGNEDHSQDEEDDDFNDHAHEYGHMDEDGNEYMNVTVHKNRNKKSDVEKIDSNGYIRKYFTLKELELKLNDKQLAENLYRIVRGELYAPLTQRTDVKSMGSNKNFRGKSVSSYNDLIPWYRIFARDIVQRIQELDEESNSVRRPKTVSVSVRNNKFNSRSRQCPIPLLSDVDRLEDTIYNVAVKSLKELEANWDISVGKMYPSTNSSISVTRFEFVDNTMSLDHFFTSNQKKRQIGETDTITNTIPEPKPVIKQAKTDSTTSQPPLIYVSQKKANASQQLNQPTKKKAPNILTSLSLMKTKKRRKSNDAITPPTSDNVVIDIEEDPHDIDNESKDQIEIEKENSVVELEDDDDDDKEDSHLCPRCKTVIRETSPDEHADWHMAKEMEEKLNEDQRDIKAKPPKESYAERRLREKAEERLHNDLNSKTKQKANKSKVNDKFQSKLPF